MSKQTLSAIKLNHLSQKVGNVDSFKFESVLIDWNRLYDVAVNLAGGNVHSVSSIAFRAVGLGTRGRKRHAAVVVRHKGEVDGQLTGEKK